MKIKGVFARLRNRSTVAAIGDSNPICSYKAAMQVLIAACLLSASVGALANGNRLYIDCPCTFERTEDGRLAITAGFTSFRERDTQYLRFDVFATDDRSRGSRTYVGNVLVDQLVPANDSSESGTFYGDFAPGIESNASLQGSKYLIIYLYRNWNRSGGHQDVILAKDSVDVSEPFLTSELDYLKDSDGDGVGDINEEEQGTDPNDPESTPDGATIDVLAMFSPGFAAAQVDDDPYARIQHLMSITNSYVENSGLTFRFRLVGMIPVDVNDYQNFSSINIYEMAEEGDRHGADMAVVFKGASDAFQFICGYTYINGWGWRGYMPLLDDRIYTAYVLTGCPGDTTAHELGHILGLGHSEWQGEIGSWRFARGHAVEGEFHTIMSYAGLGGNKSTVFSNPDLESCYNNDCGVGVEEELAANAVLAMNAVQWQFERLRPSFADTDGDGFVDPVDAVPDDPNDWLDTDGDGIGNGTDTDDDGDGKADAVDAFPLDDSEFLDTDEDGVGNNADAFPFDPNEQYDSDGDGVGDNADPFPFDPTESADSDGDGVGDNTDAFPENPDEAYDSDGDGVGDNADSDDDNDGTEDARDAYPLDPDKTDLSSWKLVGENSFDAAGGVVSEIGDIDGDGSLEFMVSAQLWDRGEMEDAGAVYIVSSADLSELDAIDGSSDREIQLANVPSGSHSWKIVGDQEEAVIGTALTTGDIDGDGVAELIVPSVGFGHTVDEEVIVSGAVYILYTSELATMDAQDGTSDRVVGIENFAAGTLSVQIVGDQDEGLIGVSVSSGDADGNGRDDLIVGASGTPNNAGTAYFISDSLLAPQGDDVEPPYVVLNLDDALDQGLITAIVGEEGDEIGSTVSLDGDFDADGTPELAIAGRTYGADGNGAIFIIPHNRLDQADLADGDEDGKIDPASFQITPDTWTIEGDPVSEPISGVGLSFVADGDIDGDGHSELIVRSQRFFWSFVISGKDLQLSDEHDYTSDQRIQIDNTRHQPNSWLIYGLVPTRACCKSATAAVDVDGDGIQELLYGGDFWEAISFNYSEHFGGALHMTAEQIAESSLAQRLLQQDPDNPTTEWAGWVIAGGHPLLVANSTFDYILGSEMPDGSGLSVASVGDLDGDGGTEIAIGAPLTGHEETNPGHLHIIYSSEIVAIDRVDGRRDGFSHLYNVTGDTDGDGVPNTFDDNDDDDGIDDGPDEFPVLATEWEDSDEDGWGNNLDAFEADASEWFDSDEDGTGNNEDTDDDADGILDVDDEYPRDTDNDGVMNRFDDDDDGDGVKDEDDAEPYNPEVS